MNPRSWKFLLIGAVVAVALTSAAPDANAHWWGYYSPWAYGYGYGYGCGYGCYTPTYATVGCSSCYDSYGYWGWRPGPVRRLLLGRYKWYWGGYCGSCWSGCDTGCVTGCGTGCGGVQADAVPNAPTPAPTPAKKADEATPNAPAPAEPAVPQEPTSGTSSADSGIVTVWVPYDAKVFVNGLETKSIGSRRQFVSYGLKPGFSYKYEVKAQVVRGNQVVEDTRVINLTAGQTTAVAFGFNAQAEQVAAR